jgi:hypothetical protein
MQIAYNLPLHPRFVFVVVFRYGVCLSDPAMLLLNFVQAQVISNSGHDNMIVCAPLLPSSIYTKPCMLARSGG